LVDDWFQDDNIDLCGCGGMASTEVCPAKVKSIGLETH